MLNAVDRDRIEAAVGEAEAGTSGEVVCVLASEVSTYREVPLAWGAGAALVLPPLVMTLALRPLVGLLTGGWVDADSGQLNIDVGMAVTVYAVVQALIFAVVTLIASMTAVRRALTPAFLKRHRVRKAAFQQFAAAGLRAQDAETGILIFVALDDRRVEILADAGIHQKCGEPAWIAAANAVQEGMKSPDPTAGIIRAIRICGDALKAHYPDATAQHHLGNRPVEI